MVVMMNKKIFTVLLCLWPILNIYSYQKGGVLGFGDMCILAYMVLAFPFCKMARMSRDVKYYFLFAMALLLLSLLDTCVLGDKGDGLGAISSIARVAFFSVAVIVYIPKCMDVDYGIRIIKWFTVVNSSIVYLQILLYMFLGKITFLVLPMLPLANGQTYSEMYNYLVLHSGRYYFRASGFFMEPSHFAQYAIVGILLFLYTRDGRRNVNDRKSFWIAAFCSGAVILSTSSIGIIFVIAIWLYWCLALLIRRYYPVNSLRNLLILMPVCLVVCAYMIGKLNVFAILLQKLSYTTITNSQSSFAYRVSRGFEIFANFPIREKLFGVGYGNILTYMESTDNMMEYAVSDYMNSMAYILCSAGVVGIILFIMIFYKVFSKNSFMRIFSMYLLLLTCCSSVVNSGSWMVFMGIYMTFDQKNTLPELCGGIVDG